MKLTHMVEVQCAGAMGCRLFYADMVAAKRVYDALTAHSSIIPHVTVSDLVGEIMLMRSAIIAVRFVDLDADHAARMALMERDAEIAAVAAAHHDPLAMSARRKVN